MREPPLRQQVIGSDCTIHVFLVDANRNPHEHVLRSFDHFAIHPEQIGSFQGLETKVIVVEISVVDDFTVQAFRVLGVNWSVFLI